MGKKLVIVNSRAAAEKGLYRWKKIETGMRQDFKSIEIIKPDSLEEADQAVSHAIENGVRNFISAGGDGGIHYTLNSIMKHRQGVDLSEFTLGAIGLGSSNDFHKPFNKKIGKVPVRLDYNTRALRDVVQVIFKDRAGKSQTRYYIVSASVGIVAEANRNFNRDLFLLSFLKRTSTDLAIMYTFFYTLLRYRNFSLALSVDGKPFEKYANSYMAISKTRHISGMFHFADSIEPDDGRLLVKVLHRYSRVGLIRAMLKFSTGYEGGLAHLDTYLPGALSLKADFPFTLEMDGETVDCHSADISVFKEKIYICG